MSPSCFEVPLAVKLTPLGALSFASNRAANAVLAAAADVRVQRGPYQPSRGRSLC